MKTYAPNYYKSFKCIADRCRHSCCKGWNVYLDEGIQKNTVFLKANSETKYVPRSAKKRMASALK